VHPLNPRYFTDGNGKAVYLTGSHTWDNFHDKPPKVFDYISYLDFLQRYNHNFIRMWSGQELINETPAIYERTGPGKALDGGLRVDLSRFNETYFERLRNRVMAAQSRGFYVSVKLFHGDNVLNEGKNKNWPNHPFNKDNNINKINGDSNGDNVGLEAHTLQIHAITAFQEAYVRKVIDALNEFDNVLYEISNEEAGTPYNPGNTLWQYHWINYIKNYEKTKKSKQHPVIMTAQWPADGANAVLIGSPADAISPLEDPYRKDPPASDGRKVIIADVDHIWPFPPQRGWIWKSFIRGNQPILMDWYHGGDPVWISNDEQEAMRMNMGYTLRYAQKIDLSSMTPWNNLSSSGYCLADPYKEYLIYLPSRKRNSIPVVGRFFNNSVTVNLVGAEKIFNIEWFNCATGETINGGTIMGGGERSFKAPFSGEAVLYIHKR
jgi:hypothetical protein